MRGEKREEGEGGEGGEVKERRGGKEGDKREICIYIVFSGREERKKKKNMNGVWIWNDIDWH